MKQFSVRLPPRIYQSLRKEALATKRTINGQLLWWLELGQKLERESSEKAHQASTS